MNAVPEWAFEFHGHRCPFMPLGFRMGSVAMRILEVEREKDHGFFVIPELGVGHPQTCMMDGIQIATGATYGKLLMEKTGWGKLAAVFYHPEKGAVRLALKADFMDEFGKQEFFAYRKRGVEPSQILADATSRAVSWTDAQPEETVFKIERLPDYRYNRVKGSFNRTKCVKCGTEMTVEAGKTPIIAPTCSICGTPATQSDAQCTKCGSKFLDKPPAKVKSPVEKDDEGNPLMKCSVCGMVVKEIDIKCSGCGN